MKHFYRYGIVIGILIASIPFLMDGAGTFVQWRLHRRWTEARMAARAQRPIAPAHPRRMAQAPAHPQQPLWNILDSDRPPARPKQSGNQALHRRPDIFKTDFVRLVIPKIGVDSIVMPGVSNVDLARGPGHYPLTDGPGEEGNCAIAAHRNMWGWWFDHLNELRPGDQAILETLQHCYVYRVTGTKIVRPSDVSVLDPHGREHQLTLITCTHPATRRIVVSALLEQSLDSSALFPGGA